MELKTASVKIAWPLSFLPTSGLLEAQLLGTRLVIEGNKGL